jgi:hypothetical protein
MVRLRVYGGTRFVHAGIVVQSFSNVLGQMPQLHIIVTNPPPPPLSNIGSQLASYFRE